MKDALIIIKMMAGLDASEFISTDFTPGDMDVDGDGRIDLAESFFILKMAALDGKYKKTVKQITQSASLAPVKKWVDFVFLIL